MAKAGGLNRRCGARGRVMLLLEDAWRRGADGGHRGSGNEREESCGGRAITLLFRARTPKQVHGLGFVPALAQALVLGPVWASWGDAGQVGRPQHQPCPQ